MTSDVRRVRNPHPRGSAEAAEWESVRARIMDPASERRAARFHADQAPDAAWRQARPDVGEHARQLATAGVLFGPDCSQFQGKPNWVTVRAAGYIIGGYKVSEGRTYEDPSHQWNRSHVPATGLVPLGYHYLYGSAEYAANPALWGVQADWFCSIADPDAIHALDVEAAMPAPGLGVDRWVAAYRKHYPTKPLLIYTNRGMWTARSHVSGNAPAGALAWHAGVGDGYYTSATGGLAVEWQATSSLWDSTQALGLPPAKLWQFTDHAVVPGVAGTCDGNAFLGTVNDLQALATGVSDDMPTLDEIRATIRQELAAQSDDYARQLLGTQLYRDTWHNASSDTDEPLTVLRALDELYRRSDDVRQIVREELAAALAQQPAPPAA